MIKRKLKIIDRIVVHHSGDNIHDDIIKIREIHLNRGFEDIGYNFVIKTNGEIQAGRDINYIPAHCKGHNLKSIGICLLGNSAFTAKQFFALYRLLEFLIQKYQINPDKIYRHCDLADTDCPGFSLSTAFLKDMKKKYNY